jgi:hypothetical protein
MFENKNTSFIYLVLNETFIYMWIQGNEFYRSAYIKCNIWKKVIRVLILHEIIAKYFKNHFL